MLTAEDVLVPDDGLSGEWDVPGLLPVLAEAPRGRVGTRAMRPVVWLLAVGYLLVEQAERALLTVLDAYVRAADAAGRATGRAGRAVLRWLGPLGRLLRRMSTPVVRLLRWCWDRLNVWVLRRMFRPLHRWARALLHRWRPVYERAVAALQRLLVRLEPLLHTVTAVVEVVEAAAARLGIRWTRAWAPVVRLARNLRQRGRG